MSSCAPNGFLRLRTVVNQQLRFGHNRPNIQRPKPPHFLKNKFLQVCKPIEEEDLRPPVEKCLKPLQALPPYTLDALDKIYATEVREQFQTSQLSAVFARCSYDFHDMHQAKILFFKENMKVVIRNKYILKEAIGESEFRNLMPLFEASHMLVFCPEPNIEGLVKVNQKLSHFHLLCAVAYGRILSVTQLQDLALIPDITTARAGIVHTLQSGAQSIARSLQAHQNTLVQQLQQRVEQLQPQTGEKK